MAINSLGIELAESRHPRTSDQNTFVPVLRSPSTTIQQLSPADIPPTPDTLVDTAISPRKHAPSFEPSVLEKNISDRKMLGYPFYCRFIADEPTLFMVRRFGALNVRAALALQDELVELEEALIDGEEYTREILAGEYDNGSFRLDPDTDRKKLIMEKLVPKLTSYNEFINSYAELARHPVAEHREQNTLQDWFRAHPNAIHDPEQQYITRTEDLVSVIPFEKSWFRRVLEWTFVLRFSTFRRETTDGVVFSNNKRLENLSTTVVAIFGLGMLIAPLWILEAVHDSNKQLAIITGFIVLFFFVVKVATNARVFESLAVAAAYSAVLMVFLQLGNNKVQ
ncbi:hypothetical protein FKW77_010072 [Venturia effusa]|uniref:DUF6594 domain-containing protein n=1 Tax=Venturia effusa TaxID=50376 RepID=A0A517LA43_9PEZI|nr:hypothetical protein FKW77_010072 [Venturia effusa]